MSRLVEEQFAELAIALRSQQNDVTKAIAVTTEAIGRLRHDIDRRAVAIVANPSLSTGELRSAMSAMRISLELEQIGRLAGSVRRSVKAVTTAIPPQIASRMGQIVMLVLTQLRHVHDGYARKDANAVLDVWRSDEAVDQIHNSLFNEILAAIAANSRNVSFGAQLLLCIKNLERAGDHVTNIAESVCYAITGQRILGDRPKCDTTKFVAV